MTRGSVAGALEVGSPLCARYIPAEARHLNQLGEKLPDVAIGSAPAVAVPKSPDKADGLDVLYVETRDSTPLGVMIVDTLQSAGQRVQRVAHPRDRSRRGPGVGTAKCDAGLKLRLRSCGLHPTCRNRRASALPILATTPHPACPGTSRGVNFFEPTVE